MGWQERDYARTPPPPPTAGYHGGGRPPAPMFGPRRPRGTGSIVNILIAVNVGIFGLAIFHEGIRDLLYGGGQASPFGFATLIPLGVIKGQIWRLVTAQYLHASIWHLAVNMIGLHFLGRPLESIWSRKKFFIVYTLCGLFGNVFYVFLSWRGVIHPLSHAVGASGCIYGLLGIVAAKYPHAVVFIWGVLPLRIRTAAIIFGAIAFFSVIERGENFGGEACHLAGLAFGVWYALQGEEWWRSTEWGLPWSKKK